MNEDYMIDHSTSSRIVLEEIQKQTIPSLVRTEIDENSPLSDLTITSEPRHSGRIIRPPNNFTLLWGLRGYIGGIRT